MTTTSKISLAISISAFAFSFTDAGSDVGSGILRPLGLVAFITFFVTNLLAKEVALYDEEERAKLKDGARAQGSQPNTSTQSKPSQLRPA